MNDLSDDQPMQQEHEQLAEVVKKSASDTIAVGVKEFIEIHAKMRGRKRPMFERQVGDQFFRKESRWVHKERLIDRENDRYTELVVDPATGTVLLHRDEPLSQHRGGGPRSGSVSA
jgi:hypothetical protein